jgi:hypothetical protein
MEQYETSPLQQQPLKGDEVYVRVRKSHCYGVLVLFGALVLCIICVTLLFIVRPSLMLAGLPQCTSSAIMPNLTAVWVANRARLLSQPQIQSIAPGTGFLFRVGATVLDTGDADTSIPFRQQSDFMYLSGARFLPGSYLFIDPASSNTTFFLGATNPVVDGHTFSLAYWSQVLGVNQTLPVAQLQSFLAQEVGTVMYTLAGSAIDPTWWNGTTDTTLLQQGLDSSRLIKTPAEIALLTYVSAVSSNAHLSLMRQTCLSVAGTGSEYAAEALFYQSIFSCDLEVTGYEPIIVSCRCCLLLLLLMVCTPHLSFLQPGKRLQ